MAKKKPEPKKAPVRSATMPKGEAKPLGTTAKKHERTAKPSEEERAAKSRRLAAAYLEQRDGMDPAIAAMIIDGMTGEEVDALNYEADTTVIDKVPAEIMKAMGALVEEKVFPDFLTIPKLAASETLIELTTRAADNSRAKGVAEKTYKAAKKEIMAILKAAKVDLVSVLGIKMEVYKGESNPVLDELKLMEKGVSPDIIKECWKSTEYDDVRITVPKEVA